MSFLDQQNGNRFWCFVKPKMKLIYEDLMKMLNNVLPV
jgi:hypothetical protein